MSKRVQYHHHYRCCWLWWSDKEIDFRSSFVKGQVTASLFNASSSFLTIIKGSSQYVYYYYLFLLYSIVAGVAADFLTVYRYQEQSKENILYTIPWYIIREMCERFASSNLSPFNYLPVSKFNNLSSHLF